MLEIDQYFIKFIWPYCKGNIGHVGKTYIHHENLGNNI